ncbi:hypothetical protein WDW37_09865 [Bdellovibrionota bacterium FG-1]
MLNTTMLFNPTGGLIYHLRALRYRNALWHEFRNALHPWLAQWAPSERALLLIGPSGGYCLPPSFLARFKQISAVDPDPWAPIIFHRRFRRNAQWIRQDYFSPVRGVFDPSRFEILMSKHPHHAVLFCNFLGQLPLLNTAAATQPSFSKWKAALPSLLEGRSWATFHDRLSGELRPTLATNSPLCRYEDCVADSRLLADFYKAPAEDRQIELSDHLTGDLFPGHPRHFFRWQLTPGNWHLIEGIQK